MNHPKSVWRHQPERHTLGFLMDLIECPACLSFHLGWTLDLLAPRIFDTITGNQLISAPHSVHILLAAILASGCSAILGHLTGVMKS